MISGASPTCHTDMPNADPQGEVSLWNSEGVGVYATDIDGDSDIDVLGGLKT